MSASVGKSAPPELLRFITWNWCVWTTNRDHLKLSLLDRLGWDVCALQEVGPDSLRPIRDHWSDATVISGLDLRGDHTHPDEEPISYGCAIVVRPEWTVLDHGLIPFPDAGTDDPPGSMPQSGSAIWADVGTPSGKALHVLSVHAPHASGRTRRDRQRRTARKLRTYAAVERWVTDLNPVILGIDGNIWIDECQDLFGDHRANGGDQYLANSFFHEGVERHGLRDTYRVWLGQHPEELERIRRRRPDGPLEMTFVRGQGRKFGQRIDAVMASTSIGVDSVEHSYTDGIIAGSDHSFVRAELRI